MQGWMISLATAVAGVVGAFYVMRYMVNELKEKQDEVLKKLEAHSDIIIELRTKSELSVTAEEVDKIYMRKEVHNKLEGFQKELQARIEKDIYNIYDYITDIKDKLRYEK